MQDRWTKEELRATIDVYLQMHKLQQQKLSCNKKAFYRKLSEQFGRSEKAYEYRMQNISYIFLLHQRDWVQGLKPAKNVGRNVTVEIEKILAELESRPFNEEVPFEAEVDSYRQKKRKPLPEGIREPKSSYGHIVKYERSPEVKGWVLDRANGQCELCKEPAPFKTKTGKDYLEVHHLIRLADDGPDIVDNCVALCPNCHRKLHYSSETQQLTQTLLDSLHT